MIKPEAAQIRPQYVASHTKHNCNKWVFNLSPDKPVDVINPAVHAGKAAKFVLCCITPP